jgi:hypothetical protein
MCVLLENKAGGSLLMNSADKARFTNNLDT